LIALHFNNLRTIEEVYPLVSQTDDPEAILVLFSFQFSIYRQQNKKKEALNLAFYIDKIVASCRNRMQNNDSKIFWGSTWLFVHSQALQICHQLDRPEDAYYFMEKSHAAILSESLRKSSRNPSDTTFLSIAQLQHKLTNNQTFVSYFESDSAVYAFWASKQKYDFKKLPISIADYKRLSSSFLNLCEQTAIKNNDPQEAKVQKIKRQLPSVAYKLYETLFKPLGIKANSRVIISTNGQLLPFAAMMKSKGPFNSANYLVNDYAFSYTYSANLLFNPPHVKKPTITQQLLTVSPVRYNAKMELPDLEDNGSLSSLRAKGYWGDALEGQNVTKANFLRATQKAQIVYFFTHAQSNSTEPTIYLQSDSLKLTDIYALQGKIATDLVCFASCETAVGKTEIGEGTMSIARGFAYSGVKATVTTLWSVFSNYTAVLYEAFFAKMANGQPKDVALQKAQQDFLVDGSSHAQLPVAWAGLTVIGDCEAIKPKSFAYSTMAIMVTVLLLVGVVVSRIFFLRKG
jgi:CHAT domain-containing protein